MQIGSQREASAERNTSFNSENPNVLLNTYANQSQTTKLLNVLLKGLYGRKDYSNSAFISLNKWKQTSEMIRALRKDRTNLKMRDDNEIRMLNSLIEEQNNKTKELEELQLNILFKK